MVACIQRNCSGQTFPLTFSFSQCVPSVEDRGQVGGVLQSSSERSERGTRIVVVRREFYRERDDRPRKDEEGDADARTDGRLDGLPDPGEYSIPFYCNREIVRQWERQKQRKRTANARTLTTGRDRSPSRDNLFSARERVSR